MISLLINNELINEHSSRTKMKIIKIKAKREQSSRHFIQCLWFLLQLDKLRTTQQDKTRVSSSFTPSTIGFIRFQNDTSLDWTEKEDNRSQEMNTPNEEIRTKRMRARWSRNQSKTTFLSQKDVLRERPKTNLGCASKRFLAPSGYKNHSSHEQKCVRRRSQSQTFTRTRQLSGLETS
jgi:hypothetical protein